ncbi:pyrimidine dimer DNA glycosylase/endonuclease V [Moorella sp. E308F]|uniref:pyrimidine dimer DNA glycosylase/endonuclease V n=1 Tax=Moorella sp. E308F TaxID=2572682 RepID=UPI001C0F1214
MGKHRELHALWTILTQGKKGYSRHPETLRWRGKLKALYLRHEKLAKEMKSRSYSHCSPLIFVWQRVAPCKISMLIHLKNKRQF